jgi:hypothetical protein
MRIAIGPFLLAVSAVPVAADRTLAQAQSAPDATTSTAPANLPHRGSVTSGSGLAVDDKGALIGIAHGYTCVFGTDEVTYTPALGSAAPRDMTWRYRLAAVGRGTADVPVASGERTHRGNHVAYARGVVAETYDVRSDGVKQSFVFSQLPAGAGDLVVRGAVTTELVPGPTTAAGMEFGLAGVGAVTVGAVLGIDAAGNQVHGEMRWHGGSLEFSLPASFVDQAVLPLTVDPLVGTTVVLGGANDDIQPQIAWDVTTATWLAVWRRDLSGTNTDVRGQRLDSSGGLIGGQINIETDTSTIITSPGVANVNARDAFVVVWTAGGDVFARGVNSATGTVTPQVTVASGSNNQILPAIGGEADTVADQVVVVWADLTADTINLREITFTAGGTLTLGTATGVSSGNLDSSPAISRSGGKDGFWLIVWLRDLSGNFDIRGRIWNRTAGFVTSAFAIENTTDDCFQPSVDGDGFNWVVAWARTEPAGTFERDIQARAVFMHPGGVTLSGMQVVEGQALDDETDPAVGWVGNSAIVCFADRNGNNNYDVYLRSIDPFTCADCEGEFVLDVTAGTTDNNTAIGTKFAGGAFTSSDAAAVWQSLDTTTLATDIDLQLYRAADGSTNELAPRCGTGGIAYASCGRSPNVSFYVRLRRAPPSSLGFLVVGFDTLNFACGPCTLVPDPFTGLVTTAATDANGDAARALPIPASVAGASLIVQWLTPGTNCFGGFDLSSAVRVSVQ